MPKATLGQLGELVAGPAQFTLLWLHNTKTDLVSCAWVRSRYMHEV